MCLQLRLRERELCDLAYTCCTCGWHQCCLTWSSRRQKTLREVFNGGPAGLSRVGSHATCLGTCCRDAHRIAPLLYPRRTLQGSSIADTQSRVTNCTGHTVRRRRPYHNGRRRLRENPTGTATHTARTRTQRSATASSLTLEVRALLALSSNKLLARVAFMRWGSCPGTRSAEFLRAVCNGLTSYLILSYLLSSNKLQSTKGSHARTLPSLRRAPARLRVPQCRLSTLTARRPHVNLPPVRRWSRPEPSPVGFHATTTTVGNVHCRIPTPE